MFSVTEEQKQQYHAFWNRQNTGRATLYLNSWDGSPAFAAPRDAEQKWGDMPYREQATVYQMQHTRYHIDGFPSVFTNFGPGSLAACIGGNYHFAPDTVWFDNDRTEWDEIPAPELLENSEMYRMIEDMTQRLLSHKDLLITSISDIGGTFDIIASMRGTENLLYDLYDQPDQIKAYCKKLQPVWRAYFERYSSRLLREQGAMTSWQPVWSDKTYYPLQCDFCAMLSPQMFDEFILPDLAYQMSYMDNAIYHLDGPGELPHVDSLLSLPRLSAIQWTSGDGNAPLTDPCWFPLYQKIIAAGKGLILLGPDVAGLENLFKHVSQKGMFISAGVRDEQEANEIADMAKKLNF